MLPLGSLKPEPVLEQLAITPESPNVHFITWLAVPLGNDDRIGVLSINILGLLTQNQFYTVGRY
jgi:hypothetical protein